MLTVRQGSLLKRVLDGRGQVSAKDAYEMYTLGMPKKKQELFLVRGPDAILDQVMHKTQSPENRHWSLVDNNFVRQDSSFRAVSSIRAGVIDNAEQCMTDHDPIDMTEWDDDVIQEWDIVRLPHENLEGRFWCQKKDTLSTWRAVNPNTNPLTNLAWTPAQLAVMDAELPILIVDESEGSEADEEPEFGLEELEDAAFFAEYNNRGIDEFKIKVPRNETPNQVENPTTVLRVAKNGRILNWNTLAQWLRNLLSAPNGKYDIQVGDNFQMKIVSTLDNGATSSRNQRGYVPDFLFPDQPGFEGFGDRFIFAIAPNGPKRIINWGIANHTPNQDIWLELRDGL